MMRRLAYGCAFLVMVMVGCSSESSKDDTDVLLPGLDVVDVAGSDVLVPEDQTDPDDSVIPLDVDAVMPEDGLSETVVPADVPDVEPTDAGQDLAEDVAEDTGSDVASECTEAADCLTAFGAPSICNEWTCAEGTCEMTFQAQGAECDDADICTDNDVCDGAGTCAGTAKDCDDNEFCTDDSCVAGMGCNNVWKAPQACTDNDGNAGLQECANGAWGDCVVPELCDIKVNTNNDGTVNPFIFPAREGQFYVSYVAKGGNMKLAWVDPLSCTVTEGPNTVNDVADGVYYWGAQWALSDGAGNFYAIWEASSGNGELGFAASQTGTSFLPSVEAVSTSKNGSDPTMSVQGTGKVYVAWTGYDGNQYDPYFTVNNDVFGANTFSPAVKVYSSSVQDDQIAMAVADDGTIYLAWQSFNDGTPQGGNMYVAKSTDDGASWSNPVKVNDVTSEANVGKATFLAWGNGKLHIVWSDERDDSEGDIYYDSSADGLTWGTDVLVNDSTYRYQEDPSIMVGKGGNCQGTIYVVWQDLRSNDSYDIYGARSTDGGATFEANILVTPTSDGDQMNPALAVDETCKVGVAWRDSSVNDSFDIKASFVNAW